MTKNNIVTAAFVMIGDEILSGRTEDKNLNFLAKNLTEIGINLKEVRVVPDVEEEIIQTLHQETKPVKQIIEEEFKIVLPKKSKNKKASNTMIIPAFEKEKKDEFPSLGSSFSPIKKEKTGFWREGKKSLEIAKAIAHIPSPSPTSSPSPYLKKLSRNVSGAGGAGGAGGCPDEENYSDNDEYQIRKRGDEDEEYWQ